MTHDKVTELLKNYRSYKYAVSNGIAPHQADDTLGMPMGGSYGSRPPGGLSGRGTILESLMEYNQYKRVVTLIDGAVTDVLDDQERSVIELKYLNRNTFTLSQISDRTAMSERTVSYVHKRSLKKLTLALRFVEVPEIINLDDAVIV